MHKKLLEEGEGGTVKFELHVENELTLAKIKFTQ
jgi:hypothetical protein